MTFARSFILVSLVASACAAQGPIGVNGLYVSGSSAFQYNGIPSGGFGQFRVGSLVGSYPFFPASYWTGTRAPVKFIWEDSSPNEFDAELEMYEIRNPTTSTTDYGKSAMDIRVFDQDTSSHNTGGGVLDLFEFAEANIVQGGVADLVLQIGDAAHSGWSTAGNMLELDLNNYSGMDQKIPSETGDTSFMKLWCGDGTTNTKPCTSGIYISGTSPLTPVHYGIDLGYVDTAAVRIPNNVPVVGWNFGNTASYSILEMGSENNLAWGNDAGISGFSYGPTGTTFSDSNALGNHVVCIKADNKSLGYCSSGIGATGQCTCN